MMYDQSKCTDSSERLAEIEKEESDAMAFGITVTELRQQRREYGQLLTGLYAGCSVSFAHTMEMIKHISQLLRA